MGVEMYSAPYSERDRLVLPGAGYTVELGKIRPRGGVRMEHEKLIVLDEGVELAEVAAMQVCCKTGPARLRTGDESEK
jgi:hypothetical protein